MSSSSGPTPEAPKTKTVTVDDGGVIGYQVFSPQLASSSSRPPLLMIMGMSGTKEDWQPLSGALARKRTVIVLDNRGLGESKLPPPPASDDEEESEITLERMGLDALLVVQAEGYKVVDLIGWSMGGHITQSLLVSPYASASSSGHTQIKRTVPQRGSSTQSTLDIVIRHVILTATCTKLPHGDFDAGALAQLAAGIKDPMQRVRRITEETVKLQYFPEWIERGGAHAQRIVQRRIDDVLRTPRPQAVIGQQIAAMAARDLRGDFKERPIPRSQPVLLIHGTRDRMVDYGEVKYIERAIPQAVWFEHPEIGREYGHWWYDFGSDIGIWAEAIGAFCDAGKVKL